MKTININGKDFTIEELSKLIEGSENISQYPIYCQHLHSDKIVKFTDLKEGIVVKDGKGEWPVGHKAANWTDCDSKIDWKPLPVCSQTGFFHGQLVWAWDNDHAHYRILAFYDAENSCLFSIYGKKGSLSYDNYLPFEGNWPDWALEAYKTLKL